ncbi:MAG: hypothetical protein NT020_04230 [Chloroflexales bacterium]|nr:hypothetical protein [Chloroflexales bacterium]
MERIWSSAAGEAITPNFLPLISDNDIIAPNKSEQVNVLPASRHGSVPLIVIIYS